MFKFLERLLGLTQKLDCQCIDKKYLIPKSDIWWTMTYSKSLKGFIW